MDTYLACNIGGLFLLLIFTFMRMKEVSGRKDKEMMEQISFNLKKLRSKKFVFYGIYIQINFFYVEIPKNGIREKNICIYHIVN